jgi:hypothetical protein
VKRRASFSKRKRPARAHSSSDSNILKLSKGGLEICNGNCQTWIEDAASSGAVVSSSLLRLNSLIEIWMSCPRESMLGSAMLQILPAEHRLQPLRSAFAAQAHRRGPCAAIDRPQGYNQFLVGVQGEPSFSIQSEATLNVDNSRIEHVFRRGCRELECGQKAIKLRTKVLFYGLKIKWPETLDSVRF